MGHPSSKKVGFEDGKSSFATRRLVIGARTKRLKPTVAAAASKWGDNSFLALFGKIVIFAETGDVTMATYTITVNERTKAGRSLVQYLRSLGLIKSPEKKDEFDPTDCDAYREAMEDVAEGRVYHAESVEDMMAQILG